MPDLIPHQPLFSPRDISLLIEAPLRTVYNWIAEGKLCKQVEVGRTIRIGREELMRFIAVRATENVMEWFFDEPA